MTTKPSSMVVVVLMKSPEADATLDVIRADHPQVQIVDRNTYWHLSAEGEIIVDLQRVSEELGDELSLSDWLVIMVTFVGRIETTPDQFRVTSEMLEFPENGVQPPA